jgi:hypothetical protein
MHEWNIITQGCEADATAFRPNGPTVNSQGREPLDLCAKLLRAPTGQKSLSPGSGCCPQVLHAYQGSRPCLLTTAALRLKFPLRMTFTDYYSS